MLLAKPPKESNTQVGKKAEEVACGYLADLGYEILQRNFLIKGGEIDIVAKHQDILVFVEVKARWNHNYGLPIESITPNKIHSLKKTALFYITKTKYGNGPYRIDLVSLDYAVSESPKIELITNITGF